MLVDDDVVMRRALGKLLEIAGYHVIAEAGDGRQALEMLQTHAPGLIVTDCQMPRMDGLSFTRTVRGRGVPTPIIMFSGQSDERVRAAALEAGANAYIPKSMRPADVLARICHTLNPLISAA